jgi:hypothetical protein
VTTRFRNKTFAVFLGATLGSIGLHRFYLSGKGSLAAWCYVVGFFSLLAFGLGYSLRDPAFGLNMPYDLFTPAMLLAALPALVAFLDAILLALQPDARFDARFNPGADRINQSGGMVVTLAALSLLIGAGLMVVMLAVDLEAAVEALPHRALDQAPPT